MTNFDKIVSQLRNKKPKQNNVDSAIESVHITDRNNRNNKKLTEHENTVFTQQIQGKKENKNIEFFSLKNIKKLKFDKQAYAMSETVNLHNLEEPQTNITNKIMSQEGNNSKEKMNGLSLNTTPKKFTYQSSSQPDKIICTQDVRVKTDQNKMLEVKTNTNCIQNILESKELYFEEKYFFMVFGTHVNEFFMVKLELSDDTGAICGVISYDLYRKTRLKIGDVIELDNFAVWRDKTPYIVMVEDSIVNIH